MIQLYDILEKENYGKGKTIEKANLYKQIKDFQGFSEVINR